MAMMEALLKIKADVQGEGQVNALGRAIGGVGTTAARVSGSLKGMASSAGGLSSVLGTLAPVVSGVGLAAMAKGAIDAADNMNDLRQKTGVSVESLSKFQQAAKASGTDIEGVGKALIKLNKGLADGKAADTLKEMGLSATDASGKLKSTDQVMLEVADKFKAMPDGAQKTALALKLFGKAGADMIPMLNGGRSSIESLQATMTGKFAKSADELNDKLAAMQGKLLQVGVTLGTALMPALTAIADVVMRVATEFAKLPEPIQNLIGLAAIIAVAWGPVTGVISGVISAFAAFGPAIAGMTAALSGLLAWLGSTLIPGLLAFFSGPVGWTVLAVAAVVAMCIAFREPIGKFFSWLGGVIANGLQAIWKWSEPLRSFWAGVWKDALNLAYKLWVQPWVNLWDLLKKPLEGFRSWIGGLFNSIWQGLTGGVKAAFRGVLQFIADRINSVGQAINFLIGAFNKLPGPDIPMVPKLTVPAFAQGGYVNQATLAMVGEGGGEYIIPANRMAQASANFLAGARGGAVLQGGSNVSLNVQTGPVLQQGGERYVTLSDLEKAMRATAEGVIGRMRTPAARYATGIR